MGLVLRVSHGEGTRAEDVAKWPDLLSIVVGDVLCSAYS